MGKKSNKGQESIFTEIAVTIEELKKEIQESKRAKENIRVRKIKK